MFLGKEVLCHGDVCLENFFRREEDGRVLMLDWEFAHLGFAFEDLSALINENKLSEQQEALLLQQYLGQEPSLETRRILWAWKIRRSLSLFAIVVDRIALMDTGVSSEIDNREIYVRVIEEEILYVKTLLKLRL